MAIGKCRLCEKTTDLKISHIIPKFVYRWLKETSVTGYLRSGLAPDRRQQDGRKRPMLCEECEQLFCTWERQFRETVFAPLCLGQGFEPFDYGPWFAKFAASLVWRSLLDIQSLGPLTHVPMELISHVSRAEFFWRTFLLGKRSYISPHDVHFVPLGYIDSFFGEEIPTNINRYYTRTVSMDLVVSDSQVFVYSKLPFALLIGIIQTTKPGQWIGTRIHPDGGMFGAGKTVALPGELIIFMNKKAEQASNILSNLSDNQKKIIDKTVQENVGRIPGSKTLEAFESDFRLFGKKAYRSKDGTGRTESEQ